MKLNIDVENFKSVQDVIKNMESAPEPVIEATLKDFRQRAPNWIAREITKVYTIKAGEVKPGGSAGTIKSKTDGLSASIEYKGRTLTPIHFKLNTKVQRKKGKAKYIAPGQRFKTDRPYVTMEENTYYRTTLAVKKGGAKVLHGKYNTPIFMAQVKGGFLPFQRKPNNPNKIVAVRSVSLPQMVSNENVQEGIERTIADQLQKRFEHNFDRYLSKHFK